MNDFSEKISQFLREHACPVYSFSAVADGEQTDIVNIRANRSQNVYSVAKAFAVTAFGVAFDRGLITPEEPVARLLGKYMPEGTDPRWREITYDDVMLHKLGLPQGFLDIDVAPAGKFGADYLGFLFAEPFAAEPRIERCYTDAAYYLVSRAVEEACGEPIDNLLWREFFLPAGFAEAAWSHCPFGHPMGATGLYISSRDMVKLGELYRLGGVYAGRRILSEKWVETVLGRGYELRRLGIGDGYGKGGMYGQQLAVFPEKKLSVAWTAYGFKDKTPLLEFLYGLL